MESNLKRQNDTLEDEYPKHEVKKRKAETSEEVHWSAYFIEISSHLINCWNCKRPYGIGTRSRYSQSCGHLICVSCVNLRADDRCLLCVGTKPPMDKRRLGNDIQNKKHVMVNFANGFQNSISNDFPIQNQKEAHIRKQLKVGENFDNIRSISDAAFFDANLFILLRSTTCHKIVYQLPALSSDALSIVISPLVSSIVKQISELRAKGFDKDVVKQCIEYDKKRIELLKDLKRETPVTRLLYLTPEWICKEEIRSNLLMLHKRNKLKRIIIDEAQFLISWGSNYRKYFTKTTQTLIGGFADVPLSIFATNVAPDMIQNVIFSAGLCKEKIESKFKFFFTDLNYFNVRYEVSHVKQKIEMFESIIDIVLSAEFDEECGIIFCDSQKDCVHLVEDLKKRGILAEFYHAEMNKCDRKNVSEKWLLRNINIIVATIAFATELNSTDVRFVIHAGLPKSLENYYQETSRAGEDGKNSLCRMFYNSNDYLRHSEDAELQDSESLSENDRLLIIHRQLSLEKMYEYAKTKDKCRRLMMCEFFGQLSNESACRENYATMCDNCLAKTMGLQ